MRKYLYALFFLVVLSHARIQAAVGDTTWVQSFHGDFTGYGAFDTTILFPDTTHTYRKIYMIVTIGEYNCPAGSQYCHQWDYDVENYVMTPRGDTLELGRYITPYATAGTPGFGATWQQPYIFDVSDYYGVLHDSATMQAFYSGYSYGFTCDVKFAFIEGTPERNVLGYNKLWNKTYTYGDTANPIDSNMLPFTFTPPAGTQSTEMKFLISGHGADNATDCCEFDETGVGHTYTVWADNNIVAQENMNINCGWSEIYPQGGTWLYARAGNWCPGGYVGLAQYQLTGVTAGSPFTTDVSFDDSYNGGGSYGIYKISSAVFYYAGYNKTLDASMEDIIAPSNVVWNRRENPQASVPVVQIRNTGATPITSMLIQYGVQDSVMSQYIWTGLLAPSTDTSISLPALASLTNLSVDSAQGTYTFVATIQQVNGQLDNDQSNDTLTSQFAVAPKWPYSFVIKMTTSSIGADGNFASNPADASWQITDDNNNVVASRTNTNCTTTYTDTVTLNSSSFYALTVSTSQCYGLNWWALAGTTGYTAGSLALVNYLHGNTSLKQEGMSTTGEFAYDFGCGFTQYFTTAGQCTAIVPVITQSSDTLYCTPAETYQWYKNGVPISGATGPFYAMGTVNANYTVEITDVFGCSAASASYPYLTTANRDLSSFAPSVLVFPNPAGQVVNITVNAELIGTVYTLYDITGRELASGNIDGVTTAIGTGNIASGIYVLGISNGVSSISKMVAIQK